MVASASSVTMPSLTLSMTASNQASPVPALAMRRRPGVGRCASTSTAVTVGQAPSTGESRSSSVRSPPRARQAMPVALAGSFRSRPRVSTSASTACWAARHGPLQGPARELGPRLPGRRSKALFMARMRRPGASRSSGSGRESRRSAGAMAGPDGAGRSGGSCSTSCTRSSPTALSHGLDLTLARGLRRREAEARRPAALGRLLQPVEPERGLRRRAGTRPGSLPTSCASRSPRAPRLRPAGPAQRALGVDQSRRRRRGRLATSWAWRSTMAMIGASARSAERSSRAPATLVTASPSGARSGRACPAPSAPRRPCGAADSAPPTCWPARSRWLRRCSSARSASRTSVEEAAQLDQLLGRVARQLADPRVDPGEAEAAVDVDRQLVDILIGQPGQRPGALAGGPIPVRLDRRMSRARPGKGPCCSGSRRPAQGHGTGRPCASPSATGLQRLARLGGLDHRLQRRRRR